MNPEKAIGRAQNHPARPIENGRKRPQYRLFARKCNLVVGALHMMDGAHAHPHPSLTPAKATG